MDTTPTFTVFFFAAFIAYILGALPSAYTVARLNGINIFEVGSHQAGATNVWREVSRKMGMVVTAVDFAKGVMAIVAGYLIGLEASELLVPAAAAVAGHWNSPFTKFKGGDGVATLVGCAAGLAPFEFFLPLLLGATISIGFNKKFDHPTLWAGMAGYVLFIVLSFLPSSRTEPEIVYGLTGIGFAIMLHSIYFHKRHRHYFASRTVDDENDHTITPDNVG